MLKRFVSLLMPRAVIILICGLLLMSTISYFRTGKTVAGELSLDGKALRFASRYLNEDSIVISKSKHLIYYCKNGFIVRNVSWDGFNISFPAPIAIGMGGRYETPTGEYYICQKNPDSRYTLFLGLSWPNIAVANRAIELGNRLSNYDYKRIVAANLSKTTPPWDTPLGGTYGIHGAATYLKYAVDRMERKDPNLIFVTKTDNTRGCVAVEHRVLRFLYANVDEGTPVLIIN